MSRLTTSASLSQPPLLIQPIDNPILCSPYTEPTEHWYYDTGTGMPSRISGRRAASYWYKYESRNKPQLGLFVEEEREILETVNALRSDVKRWRESGYRGATRVTKELLQYWQRPDRPRRLFFCQLEAVESIIYLHEIRLHGSGTQFKPDFTEGDVAKLHDQPAELSLAPLTRLGVKMATGSGKTVVMAMLVAWAFCNRGQVVSDERFPNAVLAVCPNLTIRERLKVLRPDDPKNYFAAFDLVPARLRPLLQTGKVIVGNWHTFQPESPHSDGGEAYRVVNKGQESPMAFARRVLGDLYERAPIMVLNDEAHHAWRPPLLHQSASVPAELREELQEATVWVNGLDLLNQSVGIKFCVDLSATPFYIQGSGHDEGRPFPWLVSDFSLVDAIECGIVKIPRLPVSDTTGRPEPKYYRLWHNITENLPPGDRLPGRASKPKPDAVYREAEDALLTLASQWTERYGYIEQATPGQDKTPPVLIIVCDNTDIAEVFYRKLSGEQEIEVVEEVNGKLKTTKRTTYSNGSVFPEFFSNTEDFKVTIRIDSKLLADAESGNLTISRRDAAEQLRQVVATVGKRGEPGEQVRCVVSVAMLTEGWDANNVTHILGVRAFGSQLLCEQVVGRGLRRRDYTPDPETGLLSPEYVDIYGVPFSLIPFKGRQRDRPQHDDRPSNHVYSMPERGAFEIRFPVVEGFAFSLRHDIVTADIEGMAGIRIDPYRVPTATFVKPQVGYQIGAPSLLSPFDLEEQDRDEYYASTHIQAIEFLMAQEIVAVLTGEHNTVANAKANPVLRLQSRHRLFPQVLRLVQAYIARKVDFRNVNPCELGQEVYFRRVVERLVTAIRPDDSQGEPPLLPLLNRYKSTGSTADVNFKTIKPCAATLSSHINQVPLDSTWENSAAFRLEQAVLRGMVSFYARNEHLDFIIRYEYQGLPHDYIPDYLVRLQDDSTLILEIKGYETDQDLAKAEAARRWVAAVNNWGELGSWRHFVCRDPHLLAINIQEMLK